ncbi:MAG: TetR/AcrR family transcriptional regulator [Nitrospiraceae bacterium]|nr:MAG: TetR/AcrR family transcriptional regulator [Nitrospiraceae bacterium]
MKAGSHKVSTEIRREQIVQSALRIIADKGARSLTTAAIAKDVGMSEANIYRHFRSKDEILSETVAKIGAGLRAKLQGVIHTGPETRPLERLNKMFMLHIEYVEKNEGIPRLIFSEEIHAGNQELKQRLLQSIDSYAAQLESLIKEGQKAGAIQKDINPKQTAVMFIGMIQATILRWSLSGFSFSLAAEGRKLWDNFQKCIEV